MQLTEQTLRTVPSFNIHQIYRINDIDYRIIGRSVDNDNNVIYALIKLNVEYTDIIFKTNDEMMQFYYKGALRYFTAELPGIPRLSDGEAAETGFRFDHIRNFIRSISPDFSRLAVRGAAKPEMKHLAETLHVSLKTTRRYIRRYLQWGEEYVSMIDQRLLRSVNPEYRSDTGNVRGRHYGKKPFTIPNTVKNTPELYERYEHAYKMYEKACSNYKPTDKYKPSLRGVYTNYIKNVYYVDGIDEFGDFKYLPEHQMSSDRRFYNWVRKNKFHGDGVRNNNTGPRDRFNNRRLLVGDSTYGVNRPGEKFEADACEIPASMTQILVRGYDEEQRKQVISKPVFYISIDVLTNTITGLHVHVKVNNSYEGLLNLFDSMMMTDEENAIMNHLFDKKGKRVFPKRVIPQGIRVDQGSEYISKTLKENLTGGATRYALEGWPITIELVPPGTGSLKGTVESFFNEFQRILQTALENSNGYNSGTYKSNHRKEAVLDIWTVRQIALLAVQYHNNKPVVRYPVTSELAEAVPERTPLALWDYFEGKNGTEPELKDSETRRRIRFGLYKKDRPFYASRKQITYKDTLYYDIGDDSTLKYYAISQGKAHGKIDVRYDPRTVDNIIRLSEDGKIYEYHLAKKRQNMRAFEGMTWLRFDEYVKAEKSRQYQLDKDRKNMQDGLVLKIQMLVQNIKKSHTGVNIITGIDQASSEEREMVTWVDTKCRNYIFNREAEKPGLEDYLLEEANAMLDSTYVQDNQEETETALTDKILGLLPDNQTYPDPSVSGQDFAPSETEILDSAADEVIDYSDLNSLLDEYGINNDE